MNLSWNLNRLYPSFNASEYKNDQLELERICNELISEQGGLSLIREHTSAFNSVWKSL